MFIKVMNQSIKNQFVFNPLYLRKNENIMINKKKATINKRAVIFFEKYYKNKGAGCICVS